VAGSIRAGAIAKLWVRDAGGEAASHVSTM